METNLLTKEEIEFAKARSWQTLMSLLYWKVNDLEKELDSWQKDYEKLQWELQVSEGR